MPAGLALIKLPRILKADKILAPIFYAFRTNGVRHTNLNKDKPYGWFGSTVEEILEREEHIGNTVNCCSYSPSFKSKKSKLNLRFEHIQLLAEVWRVAQEAQQQLADLERLFRTAFE